MNTATTKTTGTLTTWAVATATACGLAITATACAAGGDGGGNGKPMPAPKPAEAKDVKAPAAADDIKAAKSWSGRVHLPMKEPGKIPAEVAPRVIRDQKAYDDFVASIPAREITPMNPAPKSGDPLLDKPAVDFKTQVLVVAFRTENMYVKARIGRIRVEGGRLVVDVVKEPLGGTELAASQVGVGTYNAVLLDRTDAEVVFRHVAPDGTELKPAGK